MLVRWYANICKNMSTYMCVHPYAFVYVLCKYARPNSSLCAHTHILIQMRAYMYLHAYVYINLHGCDNLFICI